MIKAMTVSDVSTMLKNKQIDYRMATELVREIERTKTQATQAVKPKMIVTKLPPIEFISEFF